MLLVDDLLMLPFTGFSAILRTLARVAEEQYVDDAPLKEQLLHLQVQLEEGQLSEEQYVAMEAEILRGLREIQNRKREMAGLPPEEGAGLSGKVQEGSGVTVELNYGPSKNL